MNTETHVETLPDPQPGDFYLTEFPEKMGMNGKKTSPIKLLFGRGESQIFAPDYKAAESYARARNIGESVVALGRESEPPIVLPSEWLEAGNMPEAMHAACWLSFVALSAGVVTVPELLSDDGILHNLAHLNLPQAVENTQKPGVVERIKRELPVALKALEARTPGYTRPQPFPAALEYARNAPK